MLKRDKRFFEVAEAIAKTSNYNRIKIGAVIVLKHKIISVGCNNCKSHPLQKKYDVYREFNDDNLRHCIHAEISSIINANYDYDLTNATMYIFRRDRNGKLALARPCKACLALIRKTGIKKIFYTINNGFAEEEII